MDAPHPEDHSHWTTEQWRARCHLWRGEPSWRCLTFFTKDHALFLGITSVRCLIPSSLHFPTNVPPDDPAPSPRFPCACGQVIVLLIVFLKDLWADYHPTRTGTMASSPRPPRADRPSTPRSSADAQARIKGGVRKVGSGLLPALFQSKKE